MTKKIDFIEMARKLMANKVILETSQDPKRVAEDILAEHLRNAYELGWQSALASHAPSEAAAQPEETVIVPEASEFFSKSKIEHKETK